MWFCLILPFCLLYSNLQSQDSPQTSTAPLPKTPYVVHEEKQFTFYPGGKLEIAAALPGSIRIIGWEKASIRMESEKIIYYVDQEPAKALIEQFPIRIRFTQTSATIGIPGPSKPDATMEINLTLFVPRDKTDISVKMIQGDFAVGSINGWVEATVGEGSLEATSMSGYFSASTQRGDIHVEMADNRWRGLEFAAITHQGYINLLLPEVFSANLQLETRDGKMDVDYPPRMVDGELVPLKVMVGKKGQSLASTVGDGGAPIKLVTYSGNVRLSRKEKL